MKTFQSITHQRFQLLKETIKGGINLWRESRLIASAVCPAFVWGTGRETDKNLILGILQTSCKNALSKTNFFENLNLNDISTYSRNGKVTGVVYKSRKFRFSRLGFAEERLIELDKSIIRGKELRNIREKEKGKSREQEINK